MQAAELVGRNAVRTAPVNYDSGASDYSYTTTPLFILKVTDTHIVAKSNWADEPHLLNGRWLDDNWTDYDELISGCVPSGESKEPENEEPKQAAVNE